MKNIICYGDSNTFGYNPKDGSRYDENTRWTCLLNKKLGQNYEVINEGMCDRTGFVNNPKGLVFSAIQHFPEYISKFKNIDILLLWIGTNDLQFQYNLSVNEIEAGLENLVKLARTKAVKIILVPPVILSEKILEGYFSCQFDETSITKSKEIGRIYKRISDIYHCEYFDVNKFVVPSDIDGLHYDELSHKIIASKLDYFIRNSFSQ